MQSSSLVHVQNPEQMNLLGLLLTGFLERRAADPKRARRLTRVRGSFGLVAGQMAVTLAFGPQGVSIHRGVLPKTRARVKGSMMEMLDLVLRGSFLAALIAVLEGRIRIGGNPFALLGLLPVLLGTVRPGIGETT